MKVFINPGHSLNGDPDCGATNPNTGLRESDITAAVGKLVKHYLEKAGCEVPIMQSDNLGGESPDYPNVTASANAGKCDAFVSLHCNAANQSARGTETEVYSFGGEDERLAKCIMGQLVPAISDIDPEIPDRGIKQRSDLCVLRATNMPAVLVEMAFIDQDDDAAILTGSQDEIARAIARGITDYAADQGE